MEREHFTAQPFQRIGTQFMLDHPRCNLWAKPGMGKTAMACTVLDCLKIAGSDFLPAIVLAPARVAKIVWPGELARWDVFKDLTFTTILGERADRVDALLGPKTDLYVINYENVLSLRQHLGKKWPFKTVFADESRRLSGFRLRNSTLRADALADIAAHTGRWVNMSGTPAPNGYEDLWGPNWFIDEGRSLGRSYTKYTQQFFSENPYSRRVKLLPGAQEEIDAKLAAYSIAFRPEDWFDIQKPLCRIVPVEMPKTVRDAYRKMERELVTYVGDVAVLAPNAGVQTGKLLQMASGSVYPGPGAEALALHDAKNDGLESIVNELCEPLLVAYWWQFTPGRIQRAFPKARVLTTEKDFSDWNKGKVPIGLINYKSAGHGLSLQDGGRALAYYDQIWDEELRQQVLERVGPTRQAQSGYKRVVLQYDIVTQGTEDEAVLIRSAEKCSIGEALMRAHARRH